MPRNRFPDSLSKRELRRRDLRSLMRFKTQRGLELGFRYCGMPSVEFLDVLAWREVLRSVCAVELDPDVLRDMRIQWSVLGLSVPNRFVPANILDFLHDSNDCFDVYNLDFYGGFLHPTRSGGTRCADAIRAMVARQASRQASFVLIATFNVRDRGTQEYLQFIDNVPNALAGWRNVEACCAAHKKSNPTLLKLCFPFFCWEMGRLNNFRVQPEDAVVYHTSATMVHFYLEFYHQPHPLPPLTSAEALADIANRPLMRLDGIIPRVELRPTRVERL